MIVYRQKGLSSGREATFAQQRHGRPTSVSPPQMNWFSTIQWQRCHMLWQWYEDSHLDDVRGWISGRWWGIGTAAFPNWFHHSSCSSCSSLVAGVQPSNWSICLLWGWLSACIVSCFWGFSTDLMALHWSFCAGSQNKPSSSCLFDSCTDFRQLLAFLVQTGASVGEAERGWWLSKLVPLLLCPQAAGERWTDHKAEEIICLGGAPTPSLASYTRDPPTLLLCLFTAVFSCGGGAHSRRWKATGLKVLVDPSLDQSVSGNSTIACSAGLWNNFRHFREGQSRVDGWWCKMPWIFVNRPLF